MDILELKQEAVKRMELLGLPSNVRQAFRKAREVHIWDDEYMELSPLVKMDKDIVSEFEHTHRCVVYYAMRTRTNFGELISYLFVSPYKEEWNIEVDDLKHNRAVSYVYNMETPEFSELGYIEFEPSYNGNLKRTC